METLEEVCAYYRLSDEKREQISNDIIGIMLDGKTPSDKPIAIIDIAPPGSGKTGLNGLGLKQFKNGNVVIINSDELKPFHPQIDEIAKKYPAYYTKVTNQESNPWTDNLYDATVEGKYNVIFEGTGRNLKLLRKMIGKLDGYRVIVRGMAVDELNCLMSIYERYKGQVAEKGWGRLVTTEHFYKAYEEMLDTISTIEEEGLASSVEVYTRSDDPSTPNRIYTSLDKRFHNAREAVLEGRKNDRSRAMKYYKTTFTTENKSAITSEENEILEKIESLHEEELLK